MCVCAQGGRGSLLVSCCLCLVGAASKVVVPFSRINSPARVWPGGGKESEMRKLPNVIIAGWLGLGHAASTFNWRINYRPLHSARAICTYLTRIIGSAINQSGRAPFVSASKKGGGGDCLDAAFRMFGPISLRAQRPHNQSSKATRPIGSQLGFFVP
jgi:hypothetical protein